MQKKILVKTVFAAMLIALRVVLERFLSYNIWNQRIGFSFISTMLAAVMLGIPYAMAVAGLGDIIGTILFPTGQFFPGFTLTAVLMALCTSYFMKNATALRITASILINQTVFSVLLNSLWISMLYGSPYIASIPTRIFQGILMIAIQLAVDLTLFRKGTYFYEYLVKLRSRYFT